MTSRLKIVFCGAYLVLALVVIGFDIIEFLTTNVLVPKQTVFVLSDKDEKVIFFHFSSFFKNLQHKKSLLRRASEATLRCLRRQ